MQYSVCAVAQRCAVVCHLVAHPRASTSCLHCDQPHIVLQEWSEDAHGIAPPAHTGHNAIRQTTFRLQDLLPGLLADHALKVPDHRGEGMSAGGGSQQIVGVLEAGGPVPQSLVYGVLQSPGAGADRYHLCSHQLHPVDVHLLPLDVHLTHVDLGLKAQFCPHDGRGHAMLAGSGLGDQAGLAHILCHQSLAKGVVELMSPTVHQVLPL